MPAPPPYPHRDAASVSFIAPLLLNEDPVQQCKKVPNLSSEKKFSRRTPCDSVRCTDWLAGVSK